MLSLNNDIVTYLCQFLHSASDYRALMLTCKQVNRRYGVHALHVQKRFSCSCYSSVENWPDVFTWANDFSSVSFLDIFWSYYSCRFHKIAYKTTLPNKKLHGLAWCYLDDLTCLLLHFNNGKKIGLTKLVHMNAETLEPEQTYELSAPVVESDGNFSVCITHYGKLPSEVVRHEWTINNGNIVRNQFHWSNCHIDSEIATLHWSMLGLTWNYTQYADSGRFRFNGFGGPTYNLVKYN